ncbi:DUF4468 domain-containing protein [Pontibacter populi]|uniref:DUF4468 domain-containing protein n=1 Tax=Pontibacter populi TaxID=890055 RepID=A0ABV1RQ25_9BACT
MRKYLFLLLALSVIATCNAQEFNTPDAEPLLYKLPLPVNKENGKVEFQEVLDVAGKSKEEIYTLSREWFAQKNGSANVVLQLEDKESGVLIGKGKSGDADFLIKVEAKDGSAYYTMTDIVYSYPSQQKTYPAAEFLADKNLYKSNGSPNPTQQHLKEALLITNDDIIDSLRRSLNKSR